MVDRELTLPNLRTDNWDMLLCSEYSPLSINVLDGKSRQNLKSHPTFSNLRLVYFTKIIALRVEGYSVDMDGDED